MLVGASPLDLQLTLGCHAIQGRGGSLQMLTSDLFCRVHVFCVNSILCKIFVINTLTCGEEGWWWCLTE